METVATSLSNPFGMRPPCANRCSDDIPAVFGYGNPNADFHLIGDHPGRHGGASTGIPFTDNPASVRLLEVLASVGIGAVSDDIPTGDNLFMSYLHLCCPPDGGNPEPAMYADLERFFDAELRAIAAHVLMPVGPRAIEHVIKNFTAIPLSEVDPGTLHGEDLAGSGFLIVPIKEPASWTEADATLLRETLISIVASDYQQEADLTRFFPTNTQYLVR